MNICIYLIFRMVYSTYSWSVVIVIKFNCFCTTVICSSIFCCFKLPVYITRTGGCRKRNTNIKVFLSRISTGSLCNYNCSTTLKCYRGVSDTIFYKFELINTIYILIKSECLYTCIIINRSDKIFLSLYPHF